MTSATTRPVVVGLDRSEPGQAAVQYAAELAHRQHRPLRLVHAYEPSRYSVRPQVRRTANDGGVFRNSAQRLVDEAVEVLSVLFPDLEVSTRLEAASATETLLEESHHADVLVLGRRGTGGFASLLVGSTILKVAGHAACPVVSIPGPRDHHSNRHGVVVGVDGSAVSEAALGYAFHTASTLGERLVAVHAWYETPPAGVGLMVPGAYGSLLMEDPEVLENDERLLTAESMAGWSEKYPDVEVTRKIVRDHPVRALVDQAADARLLVVGCRGRGAIESLALGSVSHGILHHASGPVAIVR